MIVCQAREASGLELQKGGHDIYLIGSYSNSIEETASLIMEKISLLVVKRLILTLLRLDML